VLPGLNYLWYDQESYWPSRINKNISIETLTWLEERLFLMALPPREQGLNVTAGSDINTSKAKDLAQAAEALWGAIQEQDAEATGRAITASFKAQITMFPNMINSTVEEAITKISDSALGYKLSGAGGGGYLVIFSEEPIPDTLSIRIRKS
jgi:galactokinase/mevalonate kinase-like predicted kinase